MVEEGRDNEERLTAEGTLEAFVMLKTPPGRTWKYMENDPEWWAVRLFTRTDKPPRVE